MITIDNYCDNCCREDQIDLDLDDIITAITDQCTDTELQELEQACRKEIGFEDQEIKDLQDDTEKKE